jgi:Transcriptional regulator
MKKDEDIRIQKSKNSIRFAFIELLKKEGFSKITVKEIISNAKVNRSTFYAHYLDKYDLLEQLEQDLLHDIQSFMQQAPVEQVLSHAADYRSISDYINRMLQYMFENGKVFMLLYGPDGDPAFHRKLNEMVHTIYVENQLASNFSIPEDYALSAIIGTITSLISTWIQKEFTESPEELGSIIMEVSSALQSNLIK